MIQYCIKDSHGVNSVKSSLISRGFPEPGWQAPPVCLCPTSPWLAQGKPCLWPLGPRNPDRSKKQMSHEKYPISHLMKY